MGRDAVFMEVKQTRVRHSILAADVCLLGDPDNNLCLQKKLPSLNQVPDELCVFGILRGNELSCCLQNTHKHHSLGNISAACVGDFGEPDQLQAKLGLLPLGPTGKTGRSASFRFGDAHSSDALGKCLSGDACSGQP